MPRYVVVKLSRWYNGGPGYSGPACETAGVEPGKIYDDKVDAEIARNKLKSVNPVGFLVEEYKEIN